MLKYVGKSFIIGIPARDLTDEEVSRFGKRKLLDSGLYTETRSKRKSQENVNRSDSESEED